MQKVKEFYNNEMEHLKQNKIMTDDQKKISEQNIHEIKQIADDIIENSQIDSESNKMFIQAPINHTINNVQQSDIKFLSQNFQNTNETISKAIYTEFDQTRVQFKYLSDIGYYSKVLLYLLFMFMIFAIRQYLKYKINQSDLKDQIHRLVEKRNKYIKKKLDQKNQKEQSQLENKDSKEMPIFSKWKSFIKNIKNFSLSKPNFWNQN